MKADSDSEKTIAAKVILRKQVLDNLGMLTAEQKASGSEAARQRLTRQLVWRTARSILFFASRSDELDIWPLLGMALAEQKLVALPRYVADKERYTVCQVSDLSRDIGPGQFKIREPVANCAEVVLNSLDLILVPGVAFDLHGRRLGRGKGFYDQLLKTVRGTTCGVVFDEQIVREVPVEPHDIHLNCLLTPTRWIEL